MRPRATMRARSEWSQEVPTQGFSLHTMRNFIEKDKQGTNEVAQYKIKLFPPRFFPRKLMRTEHTRETAKLHT